MDLGVYSKYTFILNYIFFLQFGRLRDEADKQNPEIGELLMEEPREICINEIKRFHRGKSEIHLGDESILVFISPLLRS